MTLRARLTAAFLAVVLGPVMLGAMFVGGTVAAVSRARSAERLDLAATAVHTTLDSLCHSLRSAAEALAAFAAGSGQQTAATTQVVDRGLAAAAWLESADGRPTATAGAFAEPWADCATGNPPIGEVHALAARVQILDADRVPFGYAVAGAPVNGELIKRLAAASGAQVTVLDGRGRALSTEPDDRVRAILAATRTLPGGTVRETDEGGYVRVVEPSPGQPLRLAVSTLGGDDQGLYAVLLGVVVFAGLLAIVAAWWLARSTTRPLAELGQAVDRVAMGDLDARVPVRNLDEVGRLANTFNRMTREMQAYVQALTASRDQLRGNLALLGDTLSSTHDLERILEVILQTAMAATGAQGGVVLIVERTDGRWPGALVGQCAEGLTGRGVTLEQLRLRIGEGLLGAVAASSEPRRGRVDEDTPELSPNEPHCRTYIAVPFSGQATGDTEDTSLMQTGRLLGVLALYDRLGHDDFDDSDLVTLRNFAAQAGVAVENVLLHEETHRLSLTDPLTGLWNYRYLKESLRREVERASRFGRTITVLALDLDRFKDVNDTHGHLAGDAVLIAFADRMRREIREVDLPFRQGGEEFIVLLPETDASGGERVAERLCRAIRSMPIRLETGHGHEDTITRITVSIGIAVYPDHGPTEQEVLEAADDALYAAKAAGRDTWRLAPPPRAAEPPEYPQARADVQPDGASGASTGPLPPRQVRGR